MLPSLSYNDELTTPEALERQVAQLAGALQAVGVGEGDVVAVMLRNEPLYVAVVFACRRLGAYLCSINWHFKSDEARWILSDSSAKVLIAHNDLLAQMIEGVPQGVRGVSVQAHPRTLRDYHGEVIAAVKYDDFEELPTFLQRGEPLHKPTASPRLPMPYTSGTTGRPKGVRRLPMPPEEVHARHQLWRAMMKQVYGANSQARCLLAAPLYHSAPMSYCTAFATEGAHIVLRAKFQAEDTLATIEKERITHLYLVPTMYQRLLRLPAEVRNRYDLSSVEHVGSTGSPCPAALKQAMIDWWGPVITESYASSELGYITFITSEESRIRPGSAGRAIGEAKLKILDDTGHECGTGEVGLIYATQPAYPDFTYANNDSARRAIEVDGLCTLGDLGSLDEQGYLYVSDRKADMVISGGVNIYPAEIEATLHTLAGVEDCAVFGVPDEEYGESLIAAVKAEPHASLTEEQVQRYIRDRMAAYKVPKIVIFASEIPREDTGKIFKKRLRAEYLERSHKGSIA